MPCARTISDGQFAVRTDACRASDRAEIGAFRAGEECPNPGFAAGLMGSSSFNGGGSVRRTSEPSG
jgi:hypothetical protein